jgi:hypothetical protein
MSTKKKLQHTTNSKVEAAHIKLEGKNKKDNVKKFFIPFYPQRNP